MARKYICPVDGTEVDAEIADTGKCPTCGYGPATSAHQRDWLTAAEAESSPDLGNVDGGVQPTVEEKTGTVTPTPNKNTERTA